MNSIGYGSANANASMNRIVDMFELPKPKLLKVNFEGDKSYQSYVYMDMATAAKIVRSVSKCSRGLRHVNKILAREVAAEIDDVIKDYYDKVNAHDVTDKVDNASSNAVKDEDVENFVQIVRKTIDVLFRVVRETNDDKTMREAKYCIAELSRIIY